MIEVVSKPVIKLAIAPKQKADITALADRYGMKEWVVSTKVYEWFLAQDDLFQRSVLGMLEGLEVDAAKAYMEREAAKGKLVATVERGKITQREAKEKESGRR